MAAAWIGLRLGLWRRPGFLPAHDGPGQPVMQAAPAVVEQHREEPGPQRDQAQQQPD